MRPTRSTFALFAALLLALLTLALSPAREGAKLLINDLFSLSESANAYVYDRLPVAAGASRLPACALLGGALAFLSAAVALSQSRLPALLALVALALGQAYFGLSLPAAAQLLLLFVLGLKLVPSRSAVQRLTLGACALAVALVVCLAFPGVHAATEAASERARDFLSGASLSEQADAAVSPDATQTRRENHLSLSTGGGGRGLRAGLPPRHPRRGTDFRSPVVRRAENRADAGAGRAAAGAAVRAVHAAGQARRTGAGASRGV